jgi:hypothetical protein
MAVIHAWYRAPIVLVGVLFITSMQLTGLPAEGGGPTERDAIRRTLMQSRHLGAHGLGYNAESQAELAKRLSPGAIPILLELLAHDKEARAGAIFGLASQCGAAIEPIQNNAVPFFYWSDLRDALRLIERSDLCLMTDRRRAADAIAERRHTAQEEKVRQAELTKRGLLMLEPQARKSVSINDCLELVWSSAKAARIDSATSEVNQQLLNKQISNCYRFAPTPTN